MSQARTEFAAALNQIASEKGVDVSVVLDAIRQAALAAYKKDLTLRNEPIPEDFEEFTSKVDPITGEISILQGEKSVTPPGFARIAASIAKQVIMQKLNEAERGAILSEYENKVGAVISGNIQRQEGSIFFVDLGRAEGVLPPQEQIHTEMYHQNQRLKFLVKEIREGGRGSEVVVSRADPNLVKALFAIEVPEIQSGSVEVKAIAREAGSRTKIAAISTQDGVDPVGSLVGQKGVRVQAVMGELGEEKIDIISYSDDPARFIAASLSPAKDIQVSLDEENKIATVTLPESQLSLAIGKKGQNVRLAAKLTGWKIDIEGSGESEVAGEGESVKGKEEKVGKSDKSETSKTADQVKSEDQKVSEGEHSEKDEVAEAPKTDTDEKKEDVAEEIKVAEEIIEEAVKEEKPQEEEKKLEEAIGEISPAEQDDKVENEKAEVVETQTTEVADAAETTKTDKSGEQDSEKVKE